MEAIQHTKETTATDLGCLLDAGDGAVVTLVAGETRLVAHRAVLSARSLVFSAMFQHDTIEATSGVVTIADVEGPVLRQLLSYLYTLRDPQLTETAAQLLAAADKYGVPGLKAACEQQLVAQLSVETAAAAAVLAVRHSCTDLRKAALALVKANLDHVVGTQGWADAMLSQPLDLVEVSRLVSKPPPEISATAPADSGRAHQPATQPHCDDSGHSRALASAAPPMAASRHPPPPDDAAVSRLSSLSAREKNRKLIEAAKEGAVEELEALLEVGADVAATDGFFSNMTALHWAAREGHVEAARRLVARGADMEAISPGHWRPLHWAASNGHAAVVRLLLDASARRSPRDWHGRTPLDIARGSNHQHVVDLLSG